MGQPTLIITRHVVTKYDPPVAKKDRIAGWEDLPPAKPEGIDEAKRMAAVLAKQPIKKIWTTDLRRGSDAAQVISEGHPNKPIVLETKSLRPQHTGELTHELEEDVRKDLLFYQLEAPTRPIPGGESAEQLKQRLLPFLAERFASVKKSGGTELVISHSRNFPVIDGWIKAGMKGTDVDEGSIRNQTPPKPGCAIVYRWNGSTWNKGPMKCA